MEIARKKEVFAYRTRWEPSDQGVTSPNRVSDYSPSAEAFAAAFDGNTHRAAALLHNLDYPGCAAMRARIWLRLDHGDRAVAECNRRALSYYEDQESVQLAIAAARAFARKDDAERAYEMLERAKAIAQKASDALLLALYAENLCSVAFTLGHFDRSRAALETSKLLSSRLRSVMPTRSWHQSFISVRSRVFVLVAWHQSLDTDIVAQAEALLDGARCSSDERNLDRSLEVSAITNLALMVNRRPFQAGVDYLRDRLTTFPWTIDTDDARTMVVQALKTYESAFGDNELRGPLGGDSAPSLSLRLCGSVELLLFAKWRTKEEFLSELRFCVSVGLDIDWAKATANLPALLYLAILLSPFDKVLAKKAWMLYTRYCPTTSRHVFGRFEPFTKINEDFCAGCVAKAEGNVAIATARFGSVLQALSGVDNSPLAVVTGLERHTMTQSASDLEPAQAFLRAFPSSSFAIRIREALLKVDAKAPCDFSYLAMYGFENPALLEV